MKKLFKYTLVVALCLSFTQSFSQMRTLYIKGVVSQIDDPDDVLTGVIQMGDTMRGTVKYDLSVTNNNVKQSVGDYYNTAAAAGIVLSTDGGVIFQTDSSNVDFLFEILNNNSGEDVMVFNNYHTLFPTQLAPVDPHGANGISWQLNGPDTNTINSIQMPSYISLSDWAQPTYVFIYANMLDGDNFDMHVTITAVDTVAPDITTSIAAHENSSLQVYPNPTKDKLVINNNESGKGNIEILNPLGQVIFQTAYADRKTEINVSAFPQGIYFLKLQSENKEVVKSFVKE